MFGLLREAFASSFVYAVGRGDATFIGATPELLIRREGQRASTVALAGSARRSADPSVDDHLGEQLLRSDKDREENAIVARRIARTLRPHSVWVTAADGAGGGAGRQHPASGPADPGAAGLVDRRGAARRLPAPDPRRRRRAGRRRWRSSRRWRALIAGGTPGRSAGPTRPATASSASRCGARCCAGRVARCYAGCGIVRESDPAAELAETEVKLQVMLPALAG